jgi:hypothetical protein
MKSDGGASFTCGSGPSVARLRAVSVVVSATLTVAMATSATFLK